MANYKTYRSGPSAAIHQIISDYYDAGVIDEETMRSFDESCLISIREFTPEEIQALREREQVSPAVFAYYLNVLEDTVRKWEEGEEHPVGAALKLLSLVESEGVEAIVEDLPEGEREERFEPVKGLLSDSWVCQEWKQEAHGEGLEEGIAIGEERGIAIGEERGIAIGEERGIAIGEERGIAIGEERGRTQGLMQGKSQVLAQMRTKILDTVKERFPALVKLANGIVTSIDDPDELLTLIVHLTQVQTAEEAKEVLLAAVSAA
jgi:putative transcriptional regulator